MTKVINLFGSCGSGKSTLASGLFYEMKIRGFNVEWANEWIKDKVFEGCEYAFHDQLYTFAKQNKKINQMIGKVDYIICDSPLLQGIIYNPDGPKILMDTILEYFNTYDNMNFFIKRRHEYVQDGRVHSEAESDKVAKKITAMLKKYNVPYTELQSNDSIDRILEVCGLLEI